MFEIPYTKEGMDLSYLKKLMKLRGISQTDLAEILGRDKSVITNLFQGKRQLKVAEAMVIAEHMEVPVSQLFGMDEQENSGFMEAALIPFQHEPKQWKKHGNIICKEGKFFLEAGDLGEFSSKAYVLQVQDDSMNLSGLLEGDLIISELDRSCKSGQIVVVQHYQGRGAKTLIRRYDQPLLLPHSTNPAFKPLHIDKDEVRIVSPLLKMVRAY